MGIYKRTGRPVSRTLDILDIDSIGWAGPKDPAGGSPVGEL